MGHPHSNIIKIGPVTSYEGSSGTYGDWDYEGCNKITQILISHDEKGIKSFQFQHEENGVLVMSEFHGPPTGDKLDVLTLNHPMEFITSLSGYKIRSPSSRRPQYFSSLSFSTNMRKLGPFGRGFTGRDMEFCFHVGQCAKFWGFHGSSDRFGLNKIGIYLKPINTLPSVLDRNVVKKEAE